MPCELNFEQAHFQINHSIQHAVWLNDHESKELFQAEANSL